VAFIFYLFIQTTPVVLHSVNGQTHISNRCSAPRPPLLQVSRPNSQTDVAVVPYSKPTPLPFKSLQSHYPLIFYQWMLHNPYRLVWYCHNKQTHEDRRFEVLTVVKMSTLVLRSGTSCGLVGWYRRFGGTYYLHRQLWYWRQYVVAKRRYVRTSPYGETNNIGKQTDSLELYRPVGPRTYSCMQSLPWRLTWCLSVNHSHAWYPLPDERKRGRSVQVAHVLKCIGSRLDVPSCTAHCNLEIYLTAADRLRQGRAQLCGAPVVKMVLSVFMNVTCRKPQNGISRNLILGSSADSCGHVSVFVKIGQ
jgi:hypothetical protein